VITSKVATSDLCQKVCGLHFGKCST